jgi:UDP-N-acetylmuramoyl-L-alanyl-D-glutamate--2,6-diaminopimelate ligase
METYYLAKRRLFFELLAGSSKPRPTAVINGDDEYGRRLLRELRQELEAKGHSRVAVWSYGRMQKGVSATAPDLAFEILKQDFSGTRFKLTSPIGVGEFHLRLIGAHMVYNAVAAIGAALVAGVDLSTIAQALDSLAGVKGRLEAVPNKKGLHVFVDYAHTDDAIATVLRYLGEIRQNAGLQARLITVFGCGGDRDRGKRPLMMRASLAGSDAVFVTSDNPRTEDPQAIIRDIVAEVAPSLMGKTVFVEVDRRSAIRKALEFAAPGDVVVIAGKGHEDYQIIGTVKHPFSDAAVVAEVVG